jgi:heme-degrading monooxygenase HmoA
MTYRVAWAYEVRPEMVSVFERTYGTDGDWARLFRSARGYLGTELFRSVDAPGRFLTIDEWESLAAYEIFRARFAAVYAELDGRCDELTHSERLVWAGAADGG